MIRLLQSPILDFLQVYDDLSKFATRLDTGSQGVQMFSKGVYLRMTFT